jgi:hypothetical protein
MRPRGCSSRSAAAVPLLLLALSAHPAAEVPGTRFAVRNPHPTHLISVRGTLPASLHPQLTAFYAPAMQADDVQADERCGYRDSSGRFEPFAVDEMPEMTREDSRFRAVVVADLYLPGPCRWHLDAIGYHLMGATGELAEGIVAYAGSAVPPSTAGAPSGSRATRRLEISCVREAAKEGEAGWSCDPVARPIALDATLGAIELDFHALDAR